MAQLFDLSFFLLLLLTVSKIHSVNSGKFELLPSHTAVTASDSTRRNLSSPDSPLNIENVTPKAQPKDSFDERIDEAEDYEEEDEDEEEEELRAIAESHEAMSRDDINHMSNDNNNNTADSARDEDTKSPVETHRVASNFDSQEKSVEEGSDEDEASNEAIYDENVNDLLNYKKYLKAHKESPKAKIKRVPTVKKELSTQKEIISASNDTEVPKLVFPSGPFNQLTGESKEASNDDNFDHNELIDNERHENEIYLERPAPQRKYNFDSNQYSDFEVTAKESPRKLDKRQETVLKDFKDRLLAEYQAEQEKQNQRQELGEEALIESIFKLLAKIAEDSQGWERVEHLLTTVERGLEHSTEARLDARKRASFESDALIPSLSTPSTLDVTKNPNHKKPKKKKKKKKIRRQRITSTTMKSDTAAGNSSSSNGGKGSDIPTTSMPMMVQPLSTTTPTPWITTPVQWRLVAERLFGSPWRQQEYPNDSSIAKVRYSTSSKPRTFVNSDKQQSNGFKALNNEARQAILLNNQRDFSTQPQQSRHLHFGKINIHQNSPASVNSRLEGQSIFNRNSDPSQIRQYDKPERNYQHSRFAPYVPRDYIRDRNAEDYPNSFRLYETSFARNHEYTPSGREYAATKSWQGPEYRYGRLWQTEDLPITSLSSSKWSWRENPDNLKIWPQRNKFWQPSSERTDLLGGTGTGNGNFWSRLQDQVYDEEGNVEDIAEEMAKNWQHQQQQQQQQHPLWKFKPSNWQSISKPELAVDNSWNVNNKPLKSYNRETSYLPFDKGTKNRSVLTKDSKEKANALPKITMKTWSSLTSDPATWPFKLPGAKPWPKDEHGKPYNPNAELVRKLGLDKQENLEANKENVKAKDAGVNDEPKDWRSMKEWRSKSNSNSQEMDRNWNPNLDDSKHKNWSGKNSLSKLHAGIGSWVMPADQSTWREYDIKPLEPFEDRRWTSSRSKTPKWSSKNDGPDGNRWTSKLNDDWNFSKSSVSTNTWPSKWKQFAYHRVTAMPITKSAAGTNNSDNSTGTRARNAFIAMSAVSSPKYNENEWRKNDIEETPVGHSNSNRHISRVSAGNDPDHPTSQLHAAEPPIYTWKKDGMKDQTKVNQTFDPLEKQLEELRSNSSMLRNLHLQNPLNTGRNISTSSTITSVSSSSPSSSSSQSSHPNSSVLSNTILPSSRKEELTSQGQGRGETEEEVDEDISP